MVIRSYFSNCAICSELVDFTVDLSADEQDKTIHEDCYVKHITSFSNPRHFDDH